MDTFKTAVLLTITLLISACSKDEDEAAPAPTGTTVPASTTPQAFLQATVNQGTSTGYSATAYFLSTSNTLVGVGPVSLNTVVLDSTNGFYYSPFPNSLDLSSGTTEWTVNGGNGYTGFVNDASGIAFPTVGEVNSPATVDKSDGYTVTLASVAGADSVRFNVGLGTAPKTLAGNVTSCTFTASDLAGLAPTAYELVTANAFTTHDEVIGGKRIRFIKMWSRSLAVNVVE